MPLNFCKKCKSLMIPSKDSDKFFFKCSSCGFEDLGNLKSKEKIFCPEKRGEGSVEDKNIFATYSNTCKKCGHDKAQVIDIGQFYTDEDHLIFIKCGKCGFVERFGEGS